MSRKCFGLAALAVLIAPATLLGQISRPANAIVNRAPDKHATNIMITVFRSTQKGAAPNLGWRAAEEMRNQVADAFSSKELYVIPAEKLNYWSVGTSQFSEADRMLVPLGPHDAKAFATMVRAEEYVDGLIERTTDGKFRVQADLVLTRDINARQPLGVGESRKLDDAIKVLVRELKEARKQLDGEKNCSNAGRQGKYHEAIEAARAAIALYPKATLARMCLLSALTGAKAPADSITRIAKDVIALDSLNIPAQEHLARVRRN